ncbi:MAG: glycosyltransferase family 39 protein [Elusimicrobiota bacterium]
MRRTDAAALALLLLALACLFARLAHVPALSLDEAWLGNFSLRLRENGAYTPHQMNHYTGPLYSWGLAAMTAAFGLGVAQIRLLGAALNAVALLGFWLHVRRRAGEEAGAAWALLAAGSAYFLMKSRLAWEVYALQPILILGTLSLLSRGASGPRTAALAALTVLGVQNHFIYLSVPASLVVLFGARAAWRGEEQARHTLRSSLCALAAGLAFALVKNPISDASWLAHRSAWLAALLLAPALAGAAAWRAADERRLSLIVRLPRELILWLGLSVLAFVIWHLAPLVQIFSGPVVFKRLFAYSVPGPLAAALHAWGLFLAGVLIWRAARAWHADAMSFHERTLLLWPAAYAAVFIAFRHTSSLRYYNLLWTISAVALAAGLARLSPRDKKAVYACGAVVAILTQAALWREIAAPGDRAPLTFHVGWRKENSRDFSRKDALFEAFDASGACAVAHAERSFSAIPLFFHRSERPVPACDPTLAFEADQCPQCPAAPYYRWRVVPIAK